MWKVLLLALLPVALAQDWVTDGCGVSKYDDAGTPAGRMSSGRIVNGWDARQGEFPWQCELQYLGSLSCGCVLISSRWVITAAHCVDGRTAGSLGVIVGQHIRSENDGTHHDVESFIAHPDYDETGEIENDVAVVRLTSSADFSEDVNPVCRPEGDYAVDEATTSGWGRVSTGGALADTLQFANEPILDQAACDEGCFPAGWILPGMICYGSCDGSHNQATCNGDSGGPLVVKDSDGVFDIVGLTSWGIAGACLADTPSVFANVSYFNTWIDDNATPLD